MRALADPVNLLSENPAIKAAAEIKAAELLAPQKVKALKYLAKMGCGCYDKDGKITDALIAAMADECTEEVRFHAVMAVIEAAQGQVCTNCNLQCCCNERILKQLATTAYERDEFGCWVEPSARVRRAAEQALRVCCSGGGPVEFLPPGEAEVIENVEGVDEGAEGLPPVTPRGGYVPPPPPPPPPPEPPMGARRWPQPAPVYVPPATAGFRSSWSSYAEERPASYQQAVTPSSQPAATSSRQDVPVGSYFSPAPPKASSANDTIEGAITAISPRESHASVRFTTADVVPVGTQLYVYQETAEGVQATGTLVVASSRPGEATVIASKGGPVSRYASGDVVVGMLSGQSVRR